MEGLHCKVCGKNSGNKHFCKNCAYLLKNGASEETIKLMLSNDSVNKVWVENEGLAEKLAYAYYDSVLENYKKHIKNDSKENFGFNTFLDGIKASLDIIMPLLGEDEQKVVKEKINSMIAIRNKHKK